MSKAVGAGKSPEDCEALAQPHAGFLSLPSQPQLETAFVAMVNDLHARSNSAGTGTQAAGAARSEGGAAKTVPSTAAGIEQPSGGATAPDTGADDVGASDSEQHTAPKPDADGEADGGNDAAASRGRMRTPGRPGPKSPPTPNSKSKTKGAAAAAAALADRQLLDELLPDASRAAEVTASGRKRTPNKRLFGDDVYSVYSTKQQQQQQDDVGEGVDALLSLAGIADQALRSPVRSVSQKSKTPSKASVLKSPSKPAPSYSRPPPAPTADNFWDEEDEEDDEGEYVAMLRSPQPGSLKSPLKSPTRSGHHATPRSGRRGRAADYDRKRNRDDEDYDEDDDDAPTRSAPRRRHAAPPSSSIAETSLASARTPGGGAKGAAGGVGGAAAAAGGSSSVRRRKSGPERVPPMMTPLKLLFYKPLPPTASVVAAAANPLESLIANAAAAAAGGEASARPLAPLGETGEPMCRAELALRHCLSSRVKRWAMYEFHYSALDRPWFMHNEMAELLLQAGLPQALRLTRREWGLLRSSFGKPRRFSLQFLREERLKLEAYRQHVRRKYDEVGVGLDVPPDLPRPLRVGQDVTARHPVTRQLHDGVILTVRSSSYRVQFSRPELMSDNIRDVDVMPADPSDNLPRLMAGLPVLLNGRWGPSVSGLTRRRPGAVPVRSSAARLMADASGLLLAAAGGRLAGAEEPDAVLLAEVRSLLELKETLVSRIREMNDEAVTGRNAHQGTGATYPEAFQQQYAALVLQLKEVNARLDASITRIQSRAHQLTPSPAGLMSSSAAAAAAAAAIAAAATNAGGAPQAAGPSGGAVKPEPSTAGEDGRSAEAAAQDASALVAAALQDARNTVQLCTAELEAQQSGEAERLTAPGGGLRGSSSAASQQMLRELINGCVSMLFTVQRAAAGSVSDQVIDQALRLVVSSFRPCHAENAAMQQQIVVAMDSLKQLLTLSMS